MKRFSAPNILMAEGVPWHSGLRLCVCAGGLEFGCAVAVYQTPSLAVGKSILLTLRSRSPGATLGGPPMMTQLHLHPPHLALLPVRQLGCGK